jgi:hypothetical protein
MSIGMKIIIVFMLIMLAALFHIMFTVFDYGFNNPDSGAFTLLEEQMNETLTGDHQSDAYENMLNAREFFGMGRVIIIAICVGVMAFILVDRDHSSGGE